MLYMYINCTIHSGRVARRPSASKTINALCSNCDLAQQRILSYVSAFDPDENVRNTPYTHFQANSVPLAWFIYNISAGQGLPSTC